MNCPTHGDFPEADWWAHGDECSDMCVECEPFHTGDVGCRFINVSIENLPGFDAAKGER